MKSLLPIRILYSVAAAYDGLLGLAFGHAQIWQGPGIDLAAQFFGSCQITMNRQQAVECREIG